jgi:hypothetical protein
MPPFQGLLPVYALRPTHPRGTDEVHARVPRGYLDMSRGAGCADPTAGPRSHYRAPGKWVAVHPLARRWLEAGSREPQMAVTRFRPFTDGCCYSTENSEEPKIPAQVPAAQKLTRPTWGAHRGSAVVAPGQHPRAAPSWGYRARLDAAPIRSAAVSRCAQGWARAPKGIALGRLGGNNRPSSLSA